MFIRTRVVRCAPLAALALAFTTSVAHAQEHPGTEDATATARPRYSVRPRAEALPPPASAVFCSKPLQTAGADGSCEQYVAVPLATPAIPVKKPTSPRAAQGTAFRLQIGRDVRAGETLRAPITVDQHLVVRDEEKRSLAANGFEDLPETHIKAEQEILNVLAELIGQKGTGRTSDWMPDIARHRGARAILELERAHERASYTEVEAFQGRSDTDRFDAPIFMAGASLAVLGLGLDLAIETPDDNSTFVTPKPRFWPPGIRMKGRFSWP